MHSVGLTNVALCELSSSDYPAAEVRSFDAGELLVNVGNGLPINQTAYRARPCFIRTGIWVLGVPEVRNVFLFCIVYATNLGLGEATQII